MDNTWFIYYLLLMIIILYLPWKRRKRYAAKRIMKKGKINNSQRSAGKIMRELAERFIGKDVYINLLDGRADGVIKEVTDNGIVLRVLSKMPPTGNAVQVEATLEDAFLLYFGEKAGDKDDVQI